MVVHFEGSPQLDRLIGPELGVAVFIDEDRIGPAQIADIARHDVPRCANQRGVVQTQQDHLLKLAGGHAGAGQSLIQANGPTDPLDAAHAIQIVFGNRFHVVDETDIGVHYPDVGAVDVLDLAGGQKHHAAKDRSLLRDQQRGEGDTQDDPDVFATVAREHLDGHPAHGTHSSAPMGCRTPIAASIMAVT